MNKFMKWFKKRHFVEYFKKDISGIMFHREFSKRALNVWLKNNKDKIHVVNIGKYY